MGFYQFQKTQHIPASIETVWTFMASPKNLKQITPDYMGFDIISGNGDEPMYEGMILAYKVSPLLGIETTWVTEITHVRDLHYFVDEQRVGPYKLWHHQHLLQEHEGGTLMHDIVTYNPPFGILGKVANALFIRRKLNEIFDYRTKAVEEMFGNLPKKCLATR